MAASHFASLSDILLLPHQPSAQFPFPKRVVGEQTQSFQHSRFTQWKFLQYDKANDTVFCHQQGKMKLSNAEPAFVSVLGLHVY